MALEAAASRAQMAHIFLGIGVLSFMLALARRKHVKEWQERFAISSRGLKATSLKAPEYIVQHIARLADPNYICLSIAENKITVGPLLAKMAEIRQRSVGRYPPMRSLCADSHRGIESDETESFGGRESDKVTNNDNAGYGQGVDFLDGQQGDVGDGQPKMDKLEQDTARSGTSEINSTYSFSVEEKRIPMESCGTPALTSTDELVRQEAFAALGYDNPCGPSWVREGLAGFMGPLLLRRPMDSEKICVAAGVTAVLRLLLVVLFNEGEACLIPSPYYSGYDSAMLGSGVVPWPVKSLLTGCVDEGISPVSLQRAYRAARAKAVHIRALLLTSPHNPTGRLYSARALLGAVSWAREKGIHIISDEVYANCVHRPGATFRGLGSLHRGGLGKNVHVLYGPAKDLGVAGWRVGALYSENEEVISAVGSMCHSCEASTDTLSLLGQLLNEPGFMGSYMHQHQEVLRHAYIALIRALDHHGILYIQAEAGIFVMIDLREFLDEPTMEAERALWWNILEKTKVNLTPGGAMHCPGPGWFRLCYAYQDAAVVTHAVRLIAEFLHGRVGKSYIEEEQGSRESIQQKQERMRKGKGEYNHSEKLEEEKEGEARGCPTSTVMSGVGPVTVTIDHPMPITQESRDRGGLPGGEDLGSVHSEGKLDEGFCDGLGISASSSASPSKPCFEQ